MLVLPQPVVSIGSSQPREDAKSPMLITMVERRFMGGEYRGRTMAASQRALDEWQNRVRAEYGSAALFAQIVHWGIQCTCPPELVSLGLRVVQDELDHARLSHEVLLVLGGEDTPAVLDVAAMAWPAAPQGVLVSLLDAVVHTACVGETLARPLFQAMLDGASHPAVRAALKRIVRDEAVHSAFGYRILDVLLERYPDPVRERVEVRLPAVLDHHRRLYSPCEDAPLTPDERAVGLLDAAGYRDTCEAGIAVVLERMSRRGIRSS